MGSKERIQRLKDENRMKILQASLQIIRDEGLSSLSMRKIADIIEYTAPMIYEYFANKEAILSELAAIGYLKLAKKVKEAKEQEKTPEKQIEAMWLAYWQFSFDQKELYQLMYGIGAPCCEMQKTFQCTDSHTKLITDVIKEIMKDKKPSDELICRKYFTYWSIIHGLISINLVNKGNGDETNQQVLKDAIHGITRSLNN
ncbi:TetR/AcrR family transcriptional regulator [Olivibacter ginsenosidimutans]|uniref:TetR/AcrR family transcriptional regulator n=1 Tax=Olivibacter ginsenosidimutans TaxID=1176537 RepID=A0ABP9CDS1_9SPHI